MSSDAIIVQPLKQVHQLDRGLKITWSKFRVTGIGFVESITADQKDPPHSALTYLLYDKQYVINKE